MPKTFPTIVAPLPHDPRVMVLAKSVGLTRREAFGAAAEAWAWMSVMAVNDIVPQTAPDSLDAVVGDIDGFGQAMLQAGLVGTVDDGLALPAELRQRQQRDARGGEAAADDDPSEVRRKALNAEAARRYRKKARVTGSKAKSASKSYRTLGFVAGHEIRAFDGQFGPYAMVLGATLGGQAFKKLTAGAKDKTLESVTLADVLPGIVAKWKDIHDRERRIPDPEKRKALVPPFDALRSAAERHHDGDDVSCRHGDASASASSSNRQGADANPSGDSGLGAVGASSSRHDDALSSMSSSSSLSFSKKKREEEEGEIGKRFWNLPRQLKQEFSRREGEARGRWFVVEFVEGQKKKVPVATAAAADLGLTVDDVRQLGVPASWNRFRMKLLDTLEASTKADACRQRPQEAGANPADIAADAPSRPEEGRCVSDTMAGGVTDDKPATGIVGAPGEDDLQSVPHEDLSKVDRLRQSCTTLLAAREQGVEQLWPKTTADIGTAEPAPPASPSA
jgi:hypothetical protein